MALNYELMARQREIRKQKEEEERRKNEGPNWGNIILGAATAYLTAGLAPMALGAAASLAPEASTILPAISGGLKGATAKNSGEAALGGVKAGAMPTVSQWAANEVAAKTEAARKLWEKQPENAKYLPKGVTMDEKGGRNYSYENLETKAKIAANVAESKDFLTQSQVAAKKNTGTFKYTETLGSTRFNTTLPEPNPSMPNETGNPRFYTPNPQKPVAPAKPQTTTFKPTDEMFNLVNEYNNKDTTPTDPEIAEMKARYSAQQVYWMLSKIKKPKTKPTKPNTTGNSYDWNRVTGE